MDPASAKDNTIRKNATYSVLALIIMIVLIIIVYRFNVPNPNMILITALVLSTGMGGMIPGAVSAVLMAGYSLYFFSDNHDFFHFSEVNLIKVQISFLGIILSYLCVGLLKRSRDRAKKRFFEAHEELKTSNEALEQRAEQAEKVVELTESIRSLLMNMPSLTFSKEISTGRYLACNRLFAEFFHKDSPDEIIGLTDYDLFDRETADRIAEDDSRAISMDEPYTFVEVVLDASGSTRQFQTTKRKYTDTKGRLCILGMNVDTTESLRSRRESEAARQAYEEEKTSRMTYSNLARALSSDYSFLYYVNLETDSFIEYNLDGGEGTLTELRRGEDFFGESRTEAAKRLYQDDREEFIRAFQKEDIIRRLDEFGSVNLIYRLIDGDSSRYTTMKIIRMNDDGSHIIVGIIDVDARMRQQMETERIRKEQQSWTRISALAGDYIVFYAVDPETEEYMEYSASPDYAAIGFSSHGSDFFGTSRRNAQTGIYQEDLHRFYALFTKENVMDEIRENGIFTLEYRLMMGGEPVYVRLKAAAVEENGAVRLIVGVSNIDAQVRRDTEYRENLSAAMRQADKDALTGVKNRNAFRKAEEELDAQIKEGEGTEAAIIVFDVNELKLINDSLGHQAGDEYIRTACRLICETFKHSPVFRIGGDEFAVIVRGQDLLNLDQLLAELEKNNRKNDTTKEAILAYGTAVYSGEANAKELFEKADERMYIHKRVIKSFAHQHLHE